MLKHLFIILFVLIYFQGFTQNIDSVEIHYKIGKYTLTEKNKALIHHFITQLDTTNTYKVKIISSADYLGTTKSNFKLAENRASKIKNLLFEELPNSFSSIETINQGEITEIEKEKIDRITGNRKNRKTQILFIKNIPKAISKPIAKKKKVYIYNPKKTEFDLAVGKKFILKNLIFYRGTSRMQQRSKRSLKSLLRFLKENPNVEIEIQGHLCCNSGKYQPDKSKVIPYPESDLSTKRARLVYKYLVKNRIRNKRLTYHGYGFQSPIYYPEVSDKDKSLNKRVEIVITKF